MSHSSEHIEGIPPVPSRLNPSQFAASPNSSPSRNLPHNVHSQAVPRQQRHPHEAPVPNIAGYSQEGLDSPQRLDDVDSAWNGQQQSESPFMGRTSSFGGWVHSSHRRGPPNFQVSGHLGQGLPRFEHSRFQNNHLELNPEASEQLPNELLYSDTPRMSDRTSTLGPAAYSSHYQPHQQTNGNAHTADWRHHTLRSKSFH